MHLYGMIIVQFWPLFVDAVVDVGHSGCKAELDQERLLAGLALDLGEQFACINNACIYRSLPGVWQCRLVSVAGHLVQAHWPASFHSQRAFRQRWPQTWPVRHCINKFTIADSFNDPPERYRAGLTVQCCCGCRSHVRSWPQMPAIVTERHCWTRFCLRYQREKTCDFSSMFKSLPNNWALHKTAQYTLLVQWLDCVHVCCRCKIWVLFY